MMSALDRLDAFGRAIAAWADRRMLNACLLILAVAAALALPGLSSLPVTDRDEARFVQASKQMLETGDYIDIRNQDNPRWKKPAGIYWLQVAAVTATGQGPDAPVWAYRLPSALAIIGAALLTFWAMIPLIGRLGALVAGLVVASTATTGVEAHIAKTDAVVLFCAVLALGALIRIRANPTAAFGMPHVLFWAALGAGFLAKGPIILLPAVGVLLWLSLFERRHGLWQAISPLRGLLLFALIAAPWYIAIAIKSDGAFFAESLGKDLIGKVGSAAENHWGPPGYYLATLWVSFWPWAPLALLALPRLWADRSRGDIKLLVGWIVPLWAVFAVLSTKLPHYILPVLPAFAGLIGYWFTLPDRAEPRRGLRIAAVVLFVLGSIGAGAFALGLLPVLQNELPAALIVVSAAILLLVFLAAAALLTDRRYGFAVVATPAVLLMMASLTMVTGPRLNHLFLSPELVALDARFDACTDAPIISVGYNEMSLVFLSETGTQLAFFNHAAEALAEPAHGARVFLQIGKNRTVASLSEAAGTPLTTLATVEGMNYNSGDAVTIDLVARADDTTLTACK